MSDSKAPPATVSLADEEGVRRILVDTVFGLWGLVNNLTRLRPSKLEHYRVTIFGSARVDPPLREDGRRGDRHFARAPRPMAGRPGRSLVSRALSLRHAYPTDAKAHGIQLSVGRSGSGPTVSWPRGSVIRSRGGRGPLLAAIGLGPVRSSRGPGRGTIGQRSNGDCPKGQSAVMGPTPGAAGPGTTPSRCSGR
jgi:hypothetical protein